MVEKINEKQFDCYVLDLNAPTLGLSGEDTLKTQNGLLTGWVFFINYILTKDNSAIEKTVFFSDYITRLENYIETIADNKEKAIFCQLRQNDALKEKALGYGALLERIKKVNY
jgi:hypothetical protein